MQNILGFPNMEAINGKDGKQYVIHSEPINNGGLYSLAEDVKYKVYLYMPEVPVLEALQLFDGIDYLLWDGACFEFYSKVKDPYSIDLADKLKWIATDLVHLYMELASRDLNIDSEVLEKFLTKTGHIKSK